MDRSITVDGHTITGTAHDILSAHVAIAKAIENQAGGDVDGFLWFPITGSEMALDSGVGRNLQLVRLRADSAVSVTIAEDSTANGWFDGFYTTVADAHTSFMRKYGRSDTSDTSE